VARSFLLFSPVVVAFFVMLPRLLSPQFGLLDCADGSRGGQRPSIVDGSQGRGDRLRMSFMLPTLSACRRMASLMSAVGREGSPLMR